MASVLKRLCGVFGAAILLAACAPTRTAPVSASAFEPENVLTIGRGASVDSATAPAVPPLVTSSGETKVSPASLPTGYVDIPFLKKLVPVAGLTLTQAQVELANQFKVYFRKPQVTISIVSYAERRVYISGYVGKPGPVSIPPEETLTLGRALAMAGGVLPRGNRSDVAIKRTREGTPLVITKDVRRIDDGDEPDFVLEDEDQIYVRDSRI